MARRAYPASEVTRDVQDVAKSVITSPEGETGKAPAAARPKRRGRKPKYSETDVLSSTDTKEEDQDSKEEEASKANMPTAQDGGQIEVQKGPGDLWIGLPIPRAVADAIAIEGGEPSDKLHITLCFSPKDHHVGNPKDENTIIGGGLDGLKAAIDELAKNQWPLEVKVGGIGRFNASNSSNGKDVFYASADISALPKFREELVRVMEQCGYYQSRSHGYFPHITLSYIEQDASLPAQRIVAHQFEIDELHLMLGQELYTYPLGVRKMSKSMEFVEKSAERRLVTGIVLQPEVTDAQGDIISEEAIAQAAHKFLANYNRATEMGVQHKDFPPGISLVESWIAPAPLMIGGRHVKKGTWIMTVHVTNDEIWSRVKSGALSGFSIRGTAKVQPLKN